MNATERAEAMNRLGLALVNVEPPEPGVYYDVTMQQYLAWPCVSASVLGAMLRSPAHALAYTEQVEEIGNDDTLATIIGTAAHCAVLEPEQFRRRYIRGPAGNWTLKAQKDEVATLRGNFPGCVVLKPNKFDEIVHARDAIFAHPGARALLDRASAVEISIVWDDSETGVRCKARPDAVADPIGTCIDLKSAIDASPDGFARQAARLGYQRKGAFYLEGLSAVMPGAFDSFAFIAFEVFSPYAVGAYELHPDDVEFAQAGNRVQLRRWAECVERDHWPAYPDEIVLLSLPRWAHMEG